MRIHLLALEMSLSENVCKMSACVSEGGGGDTQMILPWCSSLPSHGIEMKTVGFLPLLSVVCFLHTEKIIHSQYFLVYQ